MEEKVQRKERFSSFTTCAYINKAKVENHKPLTN